MISGVQKLDGGTPIKGYGFGYGFDAIGNRTASTVDGASGQRQTDYVANELNQYSAISSPGFEHLIGSAALNATVTANWTPEGNPPPALQPSEIVRALRQGNRWYVELGADNDPDPVWREATVRGVVREGIVENGVAKDAIQEETREIFIPAATQGFTHDADGNLTCDGRWNYSWDANNRLVAVESVSATPDAQKRKVEYAYDYMGRMVRRIERGGFDQGSYADSATIVIVYDGWNPILELDAAGTVLKRYHWGLDLSGSLTGAGGVGGLLWMEDATASKAYGYCFDGNGNVIGLVDLADGSLAASYEYGPFGEPLVATGPAAEVNPFRFSTKRTDPVTGLVYYGYRHYHPGLGRWISRDPIGERGGANSYNSTRNNPCFYYDRLGREPRPVSVGISIPNGTRAANSEFEDIAGQHSDNRRHARAMTGEDILRLLGRASQDGCCIRTLTVAGHGWAGPADQLGIPGVGSGTGLYMTYAVTWQAGGGVTGVDPTAGGRALSDLQERIESKDVLFCPSCRIQIHACSVSRDFTAELARITRCTVVGAGGGCDMPPGSHRWRSTAQRGDDGNAPDTGFHETQSDGTQRDIGPYYDPQ